MNIGILGKWSISKPVMFVIAIPSIVEGEAIPLCKDLPAACLPARQGLQTPYFHR
ncbi:MAG: hypothetical protein ABIC96_01760 [Patescibacteria group bacterium]